MTLSATPRTVTAIANGVTTVFSFGTARIFAAADLIVSLDGITKTLNSDYTVSGNNITFATAPADGTEVLIYSAMTIERDTDFTSSGTISRSVLDSDLDRLTAMVQEADEKIEREVSAVSGAVEDRVTAVEAEQVDYEAQVDQSISDFGDRLTTVEAELVAHEAQVDQALTDFGDRMTAVEVDQESYRISVNASLEEMTETLSAQVVSAAESAAQASADRVQTGEDAAATAADRVQTGEDAAATAADRVQTGEDAAATAADRVQTGADAVATAADLVQTGLDASTTAADRVQTGLDSSATAADRVQTGLDSSATAADRLQTGIDRINTSASAALVLNMQLTEEYNGITTCNSISDLRLLEGVYDGQPVRVSGYYSPTDGAGGPLCYWSSSSTATDDGGSVIKPTAVSGAGRWLLDYKESLNIAWFGAVGDGVTDNYAILTTVVTKAITENIEIVVPPGVFYSNVTQATGPIRIDLANADTNLKIRGFNPETCILKFGPDDPRSTVASSIKVFYSTRSVSTDPLVNLYRTDVKLLDVGLQGPDNAGPDKYAYNWTTPSSPDYYTKRVFDCFYLSGGAGGGVIAENTYWTGCWGNDVVTTSALSNRNSFVRCRFSSYEGSLLLFCSSNVVTLDDCDFDRAGTRRSEMITDRGDSYGHAVYFRVDTTFSIKNCRFWDTASSAINLSSGSAMSSEPFFTGKAYYQIVDGNYFSPTSERVAYTGYYYPHIVFQNNFCNGAYAYGITATTGCVIKGNVFGRNYTYGVHYLEWEAKDANVFFEVNNNKFLSQYGVYTQTESSAPPKIIFIIRDNIFNTTNRAIRVAQWNDDSVVERNKFISYPIDGATGDWDTITAGLGGKAVGAFELLSSGGVKTIRVSDCDFIGDYYLRTMESSAYGSFVIDRCRLDSSQEIRSASGSTIPIVLKNTDYAGSYENFSSIYDNFYCNNAVCPTPLSYTPSSYFGVGTSFRYNEYDITASAPLTVATMYVGRTGSGAPNTRYAAQGEVIFHCDQAITFQNSGNIITPTGADVVKAAGSTISLYCYKNVWTLL